MEIEHPPEIGINLWVLSSARKCQLAGLSEAQAEHAIMSFQGSTRRPLKESEVLRAIERAYSTELKERPFVPKPKWEPTKTRQTTYRPSINKMTEADLWHQSPWIPDDGLTQGIVLRMLFPQEGGLVCIGWSPYEFLTTTIDKIPNPEACQFIVPCYMREVWGVTQDGNLSMHCLDNCGPRRFCVCDFDEPKSDDHPAIIWHLKRLFDLVMVVQSGGKSLHAWFSIPEEREEEFWQTAIASGADPAIMRNRSSFVRIPGGTRTNGRRQQVVYFDPGKILTEC